MNLKYKFILLLFSLFAATLVSAQDLSYPSYIVGNYSFEIIWVNPVSGSDSADGSTDTTPLKTLSAAWQKIPQGVTLDKAYKIMLLPGFYPEDEIPNYWEERFRIIVAPVVIQASGGPGTAVYRRIF